MKELKPSQLSLKTKQKQNTKSRTAGKKRNTRQNSSLLSITKGLGKKGGDVTSHTDTTAHLGPSGHFPRGLGRADTEDITMGPREKPLLKSEEPLGSVTHHVFKSATSACTKPSFPHLLVGVNSRRK